MVRLTLLNKEMADVPVPLGDALELTYDDIGNVPVADAESVSDWNTFFDLPTYGNEFTSVVVDGNTVKLYGGSGITVKSQLFTYNYILDEYDRFLISFNDKAGCIDEFESTAFAYSGMGDPVLEEVSSVSVTTIGNQCFLQQYSLVTINLPLLETIGDSAFFDAIYNGDLSLPGVITLGLNALNGCWAKTITLENATTIGINSITGCQALTDIDLPAATSLANGVMAGCVLIENINLSSCTSLGGSTGGDGVFLGITGQTITLTVPSALMTCNGGNPDGDIQYLQTNNTVTVITV